jgi:hypothetical protein
MHWSARGNKLGLIGDAGVLRPIRKGQARPGIAMCEYDSSFGEGEDFSNHRRSPLMSSHERDRRER